MLHGALEPQEVWRDEASWGRCLASTPAGFMLREGHDNMGFLDLYHLASSHGQPASGSGSSGMSQLCFLTFKKSRIFEQNTSTLPDQNSDWRLFASSKTFKASFLEGYCVRCLAASCLVEAGSNSETHQHGSKSP